MRSLQEPITLDFYFSFGLGLTLAIAIIGFYHAISSLIRKKKELDATASASIDWKALFNPPKGRGDVGGVGEVGRGELAAAAEGIAQVVDHARGDGARPGQIRVEPASRTSGPKNCSEPSASSASRLA